MDVDVAVIGGGVVGSGVGARPCGSRRVSLPARKRYAARSRHQHAQQRRHSRGAVLSSWLAQGLALYRGPRSFIRLLRRARYPARPLRQARRRARSCGSRRARTPAGALAWQRRHERGARRSAPSSCSASLTSPAPSAAIWSPDTGIVQAEAFVRALAQDCRERDVALVVDSPVIGATPRGAGLELATPHETIEAATVVNASGLYADHVRRSSARRRSRFIRAAVSTSSSLRAAGTG